MRKVLIPNRGEIAVRIIRAAHQLGLKTIVLLSELENDTLPASLSDEVHFFEHGPFKDNYLNIPFVMEMAKRYQADCIHPGYGFMSENNELAEACVQNNITFVGPSADNLMQMGDKQKARSIAQSAGVALTQSWEGNLQSILSEAETMPYPVLVKAAMGGGGKGMQICYTKDELLQQLPILSTQAKRYFGDERIYVEQYIGQARHIEVQVLADNDGNTVHLFERECSVQRRFQKIVEEAPAHNLDSSIKEKLYKDALMLCKAIGYKSAGTIEFLIDHNGQHYFLEMNTRIQVEHCVTEEITNIDLVQWQFRIANGEQLTFKQDDILQQGHAIELRICAEDPLDNFQPSPGQIKSLLLPQQDDVRLEIGFDRAIEIHSQFDPMIAKLIAHASNREQAIQKAIDANRQLIVRGIKTNASFHDTILQSDAFGDATIHTRFCEEKHAELTRNTKLDTIMASLSYTAYRYQHLQNQFWRQLPLFEFSIDGQSYYAEYHTIPNGLGIKLDKDVYYITDIQLDDHHLQFELNSEQLHFYCFEENDKLEVIHQLKSCIVKAHDWLPDFEPVKKHEEVSDSNYYSAPIPSQVMKVHVKDGQKVKKGDPLLVLEAMKTENHIKAWKDGTIEKVYISTGEQVKLNQALLAYQTNINR
ncbi:biotin/lipoyl-binding protein [Carboxylicivirga sp. A043]|uniref:acetyl/propionyl/methylcrotonyl-CoA carboxylase subunit alpha n=1 Tax=Carboxylicivirga litoralis TaxID=2816963 RepID=UPI0021CAEADA|nr:biotin carboxylase N-terminal domain-containing protein [Carboxylicivirga sp. A043]MCU4155592.1 biotin/lipoyl-binding protein [Carboxylicivirga sp. A043]